MSFRRGLLEGFALSGIAAIAVAWLFSRYPSIIPLWYILSLIIYAVVALVTSRVHRHSSATVRSLDPLPVPSGDAPFGVADDPEAIHRTAHTTTISDLFERFPCKGSSRRTLT